MKMKFRNGLYAWVVFLLITACGNKNEFEGERTDVRLGQVLKEYEQQLTGASYGWIAYLYPKGGGGYTFKFDFNTQNRVTMYATIQEEYTQMPKESSYRLRATQVPTLYFDTYSYIHQLADPDPRKSGGSIGQGHLSDFEFAILSVVEDTIRLKGNLNESELVLIRASAEQGANFIGEAYAQLKAIEEIERFPYYYNQLTIDNRSYNVTFNAQRSTLSIYDEEGHTYTSTYTPGDNGIVLQTPLPLGNSPITVLEDLHVDPLAYTVTATAGIRSLLLSNRSTPSAIDPGAAQRMYIEPYQYVSIDAFRVNGSRDGLGMADVSGYAAVTYSPRRYVDGYDALFVYWNQAANYVGPIIKTQVSSDGKLLFHSSPGFGNNGNMDLLTQDDRDKITLFANQVLSAEGYYVYQTGTRSYDLVSVADSRIWIRFN